MSLVLTGVKSDLYSRTNKTIASYTSTTTAVSGTNTFAVASSLDGTTVAVVTSSTGAVNGIFVSNNSGASYTLRQSLPGTTYGIACSDDGTKVYVGDTLFYYSYDSGATFQSTSFSTADDGIACSSSGTIIYSVSQNINVYRSIDSGLNFNTTAVAGIVRGVCCSSDGTKVFVSTTAGIYYSSDTGVSYALRSSIISASLVDIACNSDASVVVHANTEVYVSIDTGLTFILRLSPSGGAGSPSCSPSGKIITIVYGNSTIYISNDYGVNWINTGSPSVDGTQTVKSSKLVYGVGDGSVGVASFLFNPITSIGSDVSIASSTNPGFGVVNLRPCTISTTAAATTTTASSFRIEGPPVAGTNHTITNKYALEVLNGPSVFNGLVSLSGLIYRTPRIITVATTLTSSLGSSFIVVTSGTFTITLPEIQTSATNGLEFFIVNAGSGTVTLTVANTGTEKFNGASITSLSLTQHDRTHIIAVTNTSTSVYNWYNI